MPEARKYVLDAIFDERVYGPMAIDALRNCFDAMDTDTLTEHLIGGITKREVVDRIPEPRSVTFHVLEPDDFVLEPLPNHLYTRDTSAWIGGGVSINSMRKKARMRETVHYEAVYRWHPLFAGAERSRTGRRALGDGRGHHRGRRHAGARRRRGADRDQRADHRGGRRAAGPASCSPAARWTGSSRCGCRRPGR